ncbi:hypothetical protein CH260_08365 [Rhodococcus sp. 05-2256-B2]|nr:hypothetical protein CH275_13335 [Rhodococcus sp. 06-235-1A]OZD77237.1 hypothetical protein CH258_27120 [Rhodococcus sp. 05-2256-B4]OZD88356.1 hypothetical protein CH257_22915 [Rhodococcus sp. 05-2256-B3]OZD98489.1 hypothetical protein CH260_08365 [Rhodococcus sp. 05-2256-B2]OZE05304.1 hypothetical protein CH285_06360 [Rhodococcus sp. 05-2256-B1]
MSLLPTPRLVTEILGMETGEVLVIACSRIFEIHNAAKILGLLNGRICGDPQRLVQLDIVRDQGGEVAFLAAYRRG